ncbi:MAG: ABC-F family ATP-binding cassette domain-containing protein [Candidatus Dormibacteria bacterium]
MLGISVKNLSISTPRRELLRSVSFNVQEGRRVALLGRNGGGKTSLLDVIASAAGHGNAPSHLELNGSVSVTPGARVAVMPQEIALSVGGEVGTYIEARSSARLLAFPGYSRAVSAVLDGLRLGPELVSRPLSTLSGGEATRVALAGVLVSEADFILLDEPTNNLDFASQEFLVEWFRGSQNGSLVVTHDRVFLDAAVDEILEIDEAGHGLNHFGGNYSAFAEGKRIEFEARVREHEEREDRRAALAESARKLERRAQTFQSTSQNDYYRRRGKKVASKAVAQKTRLEKQMQAIAAPAPPARPRIPVPYLVSRRGVAVDARHISFNYEVRLPIVSDVSIRLSFGERLALVGPNGTGKSTLIQLLIGQLLPRAGKVIRADGLRTAYLRQRPAMPGGPTSLVDFARGIVGGSEDEVRALLGKVLFADTLHLRVDQVSLGELRRIELAALLTGGPDLLVLDEPTNHLDIPSLDMVEEAINEYPGALIVVTHDRRFLQAINAGRVIEMPGGE